MQKAAILLALFALLAVVTVSEPTILSYIIQVEEETRQDFLQLTISTSSTKPSLEAAINEARSKAERIKEVEQKICQTLIKDKKECKGSAVIGDVEIEAKYKSEKKEVIYDQITATYEVLIKIQHVEKFGELVDQILTLDGFVIEKIEWIPDQKLIENNFIAGSLEKSKLLCAEIGKKVQRLVRVEELRQKPEQPEEEKQQAEGEQEEEEEEEQPEQQPEQEEQIKQFRITVECDGSNQKKADKKQSKEDKKAKQ